MKSLTLDKSAKLDKGDPTVFASKILELVKTGINDNTLSRPSSILKTKKSMSS